MFIRYSVTKSQKITCTCILSVALSISHLTLLPTRPFVTHRSNFLQHVNQSRSNASKLFPPSRPCDDGRNEADGTREQQCTIETNVRQSFQLGANHHGRPNRESRVHGAQSGRPSGKRKTQWNSSHAHSVKQTWTNRHSDRATTTSYWHTAERSLTGNIRDHLWYVCFFFLCVSVRLWHRSPCAMFAIRSRYRGFANMTCTSLPSASWRTPTISAFRCCTPTAPTTGRCASHPDSRAILQHTNVRCRRSRKFRYRSSSQLSVSITLWRWKMCQLLWTSTISITTMKMVSITTMVTMKIIACMFFQWMHFSHSMKI